MCGHRASRIYAIPSITTTTLMHSQSEQTPLPVNDIQEGIPETQPKHAKKLKDEKVS